MAVDLDFMFRQFGPLVVELTRLLQVKFVPGDPSNKTPVGKALIEIQILQNANDFLGRDVQYFRMLALAKHLREIKDLDGSLLKVYRQKLTNPDLGNFLGTRFEIYAAASLTRSGVRFRRISKGGPDFLLESPYDGIGIECTTVRLNDAAKSKYALQRLQQSITGKAAKEYASRSNVLAVEVSNLHSASIAHGLVPPVDRSNLDQLVATV